MVEKIQFFLRESAKLKLAMAEEMAESIAKAVQTLVGCFQKGNKVLICGNGGSAADAQHFAAEFVNRYKIQRPSLPALALTTDSSALTSIANDVGFDFVFAQQVRAFGRSGDVLIAITTSDIDLASHGHSSNIGQALVVAQDLGLTTIGLVSEKSKKILDYLNISLPVPHTETPRIQEAHITLIHILTELTETLLYPQQS